jgi:hypothetical protein
LAQWRLAVERANYEAQRADSRYRAIDPDNRLVARGIEAEWESCLRELEKAKAELARREQQRPKILSADERGRLLALGSDLLKVWQAPTTSARDKKELLRTFLEEVIVTVHKNEGRTHLTLLWRGGTLTDVDLDTPRYLPTGVRTDEDTIALLRRLAAHHPDSVIAGILNRQGRKSAYGHRFTANLVSSLRRQWDIPRFERAINPPESELLNIKQTAAELGVATSTIHRWLNDGIIAGARSRVGVAAQMGAQARPDRPRPRCRRVCKQRITPSIGLDAEKSAELRDRLLQEIKSFETDEALAVWAYRSLSSKNTLTKEDAEAVEAAYLAKVEGASNGQTAGAGALSIQEQGESARSPAAPPAFVARPAKPPRRRSKVHLAFVASQPCLICKTMPCDAHHVKVAQNGEVL